MTAPAVCAAASVPRCALVTSLLLIRIKPWKRSLLWVTSNTGIFYVRKLNSYTYLYSRAIQEILKGREVDASSEDEDTDISEDEDLRTDELQLSLMDLTPQFASFFSS